MADVQARHGIEIELSDPSERRSLRAWLERVPGVRVEQMPTLPRLGEQGAVDVLTVLASGSGVLAVAIRTLPEFIRSRRSNLTLSLKTADGRQYTLRAENVSELSILVDELLEDD